MPPRKGPNRPTPPAPPGPRQGTAARTVWLEQRSQELLAEVQRLVKARREDEAFVLVFEELSLVLLELGGIRQKT